MNESWAQVFTLLFANFGIIWWFRKESREDWKRCDDQILAIREIGNNINLEMKDFHNRLCEIESRRIGDK